MPEADFASPRRDIPAAIDTDSLASLHDPDGMESIDDPEDMDGAEVLETEEPPARRREGLPPAFRMRHSSHYVEQLMGDAPIQTIRQIALADVEGPSRPDVDLDGLVDSVRQFGILQPLVVARRCAGAGYRVIAGVNRLAAAHVAALATVPCVVMEADDEQVAALQSEAARRGVVQASPAPTVEPVGKAGAPDVDGWLLRGAFREIGGMLGCLTTLVPLAADQPESGFAGSVLRDLIRVETDRAATMAAAALLIDEKDGGAVEGETFDCGDVLRRVHDKIALAARLKGVHLEWPELAVDAAARGRFEALGTAWASLLYVYVAMARAGDRVAVTFETPKVRPAVLFQVALHRESPAGEDDAAGWAARAAGTAADILLAGVEHCARQHGGRFAQDYGGPSVRGLFVIPQPID